VRVAGRRAVWIGAWGEARLRIAARFEGRPGDRPGVGLGIRDEIRVVVSARISGGGLGRKGAPRAVRRSEGRIGLGIGVDRRVAGVRVRRDRVSAAATSHFEPSRSSSLKRRGARPISRNGRLVRESFISRKRRAGRSSRRDGHRGNSVAIGPRQARDEAGTRPELGDRGPALPAAGSNALEAVRNGLRAVARSGRIGGVTSAADPVAGTRVDLASVRTGGRPVRRAEVRAGERVQDRERVSGRDRDPGRDRSRGRERERGRRVEAASARAAATRQAGVPALAAAALVGVRDPDRVREIVRVGAAEREAAGPEAAVTAALRGVRDRLYGALPAVESGSAFLFAGKGTRPDGTSSGAQAGLFGMGSQCGTTF
jgi:hypothetical protein